MKIRKLIIAQCANYQGKGPFGIIHYCWMKEKSNAGQCVYFSPNGFCKWFEEAVLPLDEELREKYFEAKEGGEKEDGGRKIEFREIENRPAYQRESPGRSPRSVKVISPKAPKPGLPLDKPIRKGILPRAIIHGLASEK